MAGSGGPFWLKNSTADIQVLRYQLTRTKACMYIFFTSVHILHALLRVRVLSLTQPPTPSCLLAGPTRCSSRCSCVLNTMCLRRFVKITLVNRASDNIDRAGRVNICNLWAQWWLMTRAFSARMNNCTFNIENVLTFVYWQQLRLKTSRSGCIFEGQRSRGSWTEWCRKKFIFKCIPFKSLRIKELLKMAHELCLLKSWNHLPHLLRVLAKIKSGTNAVWIKRPTIVVYPKSWRFQHEIYSSCCPAVCSAWIVRHGKAHNLQILDIPQVEGSGRQKHKYSQKRCRRRRHHVHLDGIFPFLF